jgi:ribosome-binding protein aMBF1 (putative translation factor)
MATVSTRHSRRPKAKKARHAGGAPRRTPSCRLGVVIEQAADAAGLHLDEVAAKAGITFVALNDIRRGKTKNPSGMTLAKLARALGIPSDRLVAAL